MESELTRYHPQMSHSHSSLSTLIRAIYLINIPTVASSLLSFEGAKINTYTI